MNMRKIIILQGCVFGVSGAKLLIIVTGFA